MFQTWNWKNGSAFFFAVALYMAIPILMVGDVEKITKENLRWAGVFHQKSIHWRIFLQGTLLFLWGLITGERLTRKMLAIAKQQRECPPATKNVYWRAERKLSPITRWLERVSIGNNQLLLSRGSCSWGDFSIYCCLLEPPPFSALYGLGNPFPPLPSSSGYFERNDNQLMSTSVGFLKIHLSKSSYLRHNCYQSRQGQDEVRVSNQEPQSMCS